MKTTTVMKKLMFTLVIAALLHGATAKAAYIGTLTAGGSYSFEVVATGSVEWAVTFMSVVRGRLQIDNVISGPGNFPPVNIPIPACAERVILQFDTRNGSASIRIISGGVFQEVFANPEARVVAEVVP